MNDNASMLNMNSSPNIIDRIPIMILLAVNPANTNAIPKNNKYSKKNTTTVGYSNNNGYYSRTKNWENYKN